MRYRNAKKLHNEDEIARKSDGRILRVVEVYAGDGIATVLCDDGNEYVHTEIR